MHHAHAAATATKSCLDNERESDLTRDVQCIFAIRHRCLRTAKGRHTEALGQSPRGGLVTHHLEQFRSRTHEGDSRSRTRSSKLRIFAQKAVTRVNGLSPGLFG